MNTQYVLLIFTSQSSTVKHFPLMWMLQKLKQHLLPLLKYFKICQRRKQQQLLQAHLDFFLAVFVRINKITETHHNNNSETAKDFFF